MAKSLTRSELDSLLETAKKHSLMDWLMILVTFNHGLRVSETLALTPKNFDGSRLTVQRLKGSRKTTQPLLPEEKDALLFLAQSANSGSAVLFPCYGRKYFWRKMREYGAEAGVPTHKCHPHALKHTCGKLGLKGGMGIPELQKYLGHVSGANTMVYLEADEDEAAAAFANAAGR